MPGGCLFVIRARLDVSFIHAQPGGHKADVRGAKLFAEELVPRAKVACRENKASLIGRRAKALTQLLEACGQGEELFALQMIEDRRGLERLNLRRIENLNRGHG